MKIDLAKKIIVLSFVLSSSLAAHANLTCSRLFSNDKLDALVNHTSTVNEKIRKFSREDNALVFSLFEVAKKSEDGKTRILNPEQLDLVNLMSKNQYSIGESISKKVLENLLVQKFKPLAVYFAKKYHVDNPEKYEIQDLIQSAYIGLIEAVNNYKSTNDYAFSSMARYLILNEINSYRSTVHSPFSGLNNAAAITKHMQVMSVYQRIKGVSEQSPSAELIFELLPTFYNTKFTLKYVEQALQLEYLNAASNSAMKLEEFKHDLDGNELFGQKDLDLTGTLKSESSTFSDVVKIELRKKFDEAATHLDDRQRMVLAFRFGFDGLPQHTLDQVGELLGVTKERVRQIEAKALRILRHPRVNEKLVDFVDFNPHYNKD